MLFDNSMGISNVDIYMSFDSEGICKIYLQGCYRKNLRSLEAYLQQAATPSPSVVVVVVVKISKLSKVNYKHR